MKTFTTIAFWLFPFITFTQNISKLTDIDCEEIKKRREYKQVLGRGTLLHISCKDLTHFFLLLEEETDSSGILLNSSYKVIGRNLKLTSVGPDFFVVKRKSVPTKYQYTFETKSWRLDKAVSPSWSTGNREDP